MADNHAFTEEEMEVNEHLGYPKAYGSLCRGRDTVPYSLGPPFTFTPYALQPDEVLKAEELELMFPIIDPKAKPTAKPKIFISLLWKQLNHLGNAGFDPAVIRVDPFGNVLYFHADSASPLAWDIDHWFPCSRGGLTVPSNLRILQWQACKRKHKKLEFLIPWWELQLGVSVNQFLSIFASSNSDFRQRAFSFLFSDGENEEVNSSQSVNGHSFPHHFLESREKMGLAPAAIVVSRRQSPSREASSVLKSLDHNKQLWPHHAAIASRKVKLMKENENPDQGMNTYQAIVMARDSLKQKEETKKLQAEVQELDNEVIQMKRKNEEDKLAIQDLELALIKRRRRAEKCRRLAEAQSSYRTMLEKMIRDAMHQSVVYKEQVRLNKAAANALMARLEAQKAICDTSEKELHRIHKHKDEIEKQIRPDWEKARKRSRVNDDFLINDKEDDQRSVLYLPGIKPRTPLHRELRTLLEEEQRASLICSSPVNEQKGEGDHDNEEHEIVALKEIEEEALEMGEISSRCTEGFFSVLREQEREEDGDTRKLRGRENVEKWLQMLLENTPEGPPSVDGKDHTEPTSSDDMIKNLNLKYPHEYETCKEELSEKQCEAKKDEIVGVKSPKPVTAEVAPPSLLSHVSKTRKEELAEKECEAKTDEIVGVKSPKPVTAEVGSGRKVESKEKCERGGKEKVLVRSESARTFRRIPSSPSIILGMKKGVDCIRKKSVVFSDDEGDENYASRRNFLGSSFKSIKKAVKM